MKIIQLFLFCIVGSTSIFSQGNYRRENYGNRSILLNGNVTGSVEDLGLTYYNPSRLAIIDNPAFSISGKAYELNSVSLTNAFGDGTRVNNSKFNGIPSMVAGTFEVKFLPKDKFAYAFISRTNDDTSFSFDTGLLSGEVNTGIPGAESFIGRISLTDRITDEWIGATWARKINDKFSVGISSFFSIYEMSGDGSTLYTGQGADDSVTSYNSQLTYSQKNYGFFFKAGVSYKVPQLELGLNVNFPYIGLGFLNEASFSGEEFLAGNGADNIFNFISLSGLDNKRKTAAGVAFGAGIPIKKNKIHLNVEWYDGVKKYRRIDIPNFVTQTNSNEPLDFDEELRSVINFGIGGEFFISRKVSAYASFSSDFSSYVENTNLFDIINQNDGDINYESDYWHYGAGIDLKLKWGTFLLGSTYSSTTSNFVQPINFPTQALDPDVNTSDSKLKIERWRFIIGIEIPLLKEKLSKLKGKISKEDSKNEKTTE